MGDVEDDIGYLCDDPSCDLGTGGLGLTSAQVRARVLALREKPAPDSDETDEGDEEEEPVDEEVEEDADEEAEPDAIDPLREGAPCPVCRAARPPREGKLLAVRNRGVLRGMLAATTGLLGLNFWSLIQSDSTTDTDRCLDALHKACGDPGKSKTTKFTYGRPIVATVLEARPFDGHVLRYGNQDSKVFEGKKPTEGAAKYGLEHGPPGPAARAAPYYIRELQEDLIWLGYLSTSRGGPTPGKFDLCTLGAVLGFKQDLVEVYGIAVSDKMLAIPPGTLLPESFSTAIWTQAKFVSPARMILDWKSALTQASALLQGILVSFRDVLAKPKSARAFRAGLAGVEKRRGELDALAAGWPHLAPLERVTQPFTPFAPKPASKTVDQLDPVPANKTPKCADFAALAKDEIWSSKEYNARVENFDAFKPVLGTVLSTVQSLLDGIADVRGRIAELSPSADVRSDWDAASPKLEPTLTRLGKLLPLVRFWTLDSPAQLEAWLTHIVDMGTVDQPTAVYLKTLRQGGRIGPQRRPAYQLASLTAKDDYPSVDAGAKAVREHCLGRKANQSGNSATTMPEIIALQFFGNESRMTFTHALGNFVTYGDRNARLVKLGIDTNAHRKGSFDAVFHAGGDWYWSRGWGIGQATERDVVKDGVQHRRGLPIMPSDTEAVRHPKAYVDYKESIPDAIDNKVLPKYNTYSVKRDCTYGELPGGHYYDCHSCLKRFTDNQLTGSGKHGRGGVFVPTSKTSAGSLAGATGVFVDFERYTPYARGDSGVEDPAALAEYENFFGVGAAAEAPSDDVLAALRLLNGKNSYALAAKKVAKKRKVDKAVVLAGLRVAVQAVPRGRRAQAPGPAQEAEAAQAAQEVQGEGRAGAHSGARAGGRGRPHHQEHQGSVRVAEETMSVTRHARLTIMAMVLSACGTASPPREHEPPAAPAPKTAEPTPPATPATAQENCVDEPGMVQIPGGDYFYSKDKKTHPVAPFWIDRTEVTVKSYRAFVAAGNPSPHAPTEAHQSGLVCTWGLPDNDELPINCIDWHQADAYCRWAGKRLPTAQEWGWAAQGREEDRRYPWGDAKPSCDLAVIDQDRTDAAMGCGRDQPWAVGTKPTDVTRDGVLDMFGNVGEPTSSGFNEDEKSTRVGKGASWATAASERQTVDEFGWYVVRESWGHGAGVRCARDATSGSKSCSASIGEKP